MPDRQDDLNPGSDLAPFADALARLAPQPPQLSRDALLFAAGQAAAQPRLGPWFWPAAAAGFAGLSVALGAFAISPNASPQYVDRVQIVYLPAPTAEPRPGEALTNVVPEPGKPRARSADELEAARMLQVRRDVLRWGVDMLPPSESAGGRGPSPDVAARELNRWLNLPPGTFTLPAHQPRKTEPKDDNEP